ncbi:MAG: diaminopimelate epimerase [Clostridia bacterium]|nr:diaminopimelate epimerase [Clostridia bacterium]
MRFTKMEGTGNDYIYLNGFEETVNDPAALSILMSRDHFGCGADGLILILPGSRADFRMRIFNKDGSEAEMCGNGIRCVAKYCYERRLTGKTAFTIESGGAVKHVVCLLRDGTVHSVRVDMGEPVLEGSRIPSAITGNPVANHPLKALEQYFSVTLVNMGNPHAITLVEELSSAPVLTAGPAIEKHPAFPQRINVEFVQVLDSSHVKMRVWERGSGETLACGTGACAALVACALNGRTGRSADITLPGGALHIEWSEKDNHVYMTGPANFVYEGEWFPGV